MDIIRQLGPLAFASRLKRISDRLIKDVSRLYSDLDYRFEASWFPLLYLLDKTGPMGITEIARSLQLSHPAVNQFAKGMTNAGLLHSERDPADDRRRLISLSPEGKSLAAHLRPLWKDIATATEQLIAEGGIDLLTALDAMERNLDRMDMYERVNDLVKKRQAMAVELLYYKPQFKRHFERLNLEWLNKYFSVEEKDRAILADPNGQVIKKGGRIIFARVNGRIVGTTALLKRDDATYEIAKMAVTETAQGRQVGTSLLLKALDDARNAGARRVVLETSPRLTSAVALYRKYGFEQEMGETDRMTGYARPTILMSLRLKN